MDRQEIIQDRASKWLLSIIVPVFNVEQYLSQCIESILSQHYDHFELLLIDDGSTDSSGDICESYAQQDKRIKVFHKKNEGLAATRNYGIEKARGEYLGFVDSDDWIYEDMFSNMMDVAIKQNASIVCCNFDLQFENNVVERGSTGVEEYAADEAIVNLFYPQYYQFFAPNKIFLKEIFSDIRFPEGKHFEDIPTIYNAFLKCNSVFFVKKSGYVYRQRQESITNNSFNAKTIELVEAAEYVLNDSVEKYPSKRDELVVGYMRYYISFLDKAIVGKSHELKKFEDTICRIVKQNVSIIINNKKLSYPRKIQFLVCGLFPRLYEKLAVMKARLKN